MTQQHTQLFRLRGSPSPRLVDMTGQRVGELTVLQRVFPNRGTNALWLCRCACGREVVRRGIELRRGTVNCGKHGGPRHVVHGHTWAGGRSPTYTSWARLVERRRPQVCAAWHDFRRFVRDMGDRPPGTSLRRLDPSLPYQPGNVAWLHP
jgi:hypothetical protein